jgi:hypothetical protein
MKANDLEKIFVTWNESIYFGRDLVSFGMEANDLEEIFVTWNESK